MYVCRQDSGRMWEKKNYISAPSIFFFLDREAVYKIRVCVCVCVVWKGRRFSYLLRRAQKQR